jgi:hypothetical protein
LAENPSITAEFVLKTLDTFQWEFRRLSSNPMSYGTNTKRRAYLF